jgi:hypothetical protein
MQRKPHNKQNVQNRRILLELPTMTSASQRILNKADISFL